MSRDPQDDAAHCATEVGNDDCNETSTASSFIFAVVLTVVCFAVGLLLSEVFR